MSFPFKPNKKSTDKKMPGQKPASLMALGLAALIAGIGNAAAESATYGHAEVTVGFPNGHVTVGKTWETDEEQVVVNDPDYEDDREYDDEEDYDDDAYEAEKRIIITKRKKCHPKKVVVIERRPRCDSRVVVIRPPNPRVVVIRTPDRRIVCPPRRDIIINHRDYHGGHHYGWNHHDWNRHSNGGNHGGNYNGGNSGGNSGGNGGHHIDNGQGGGRDLFGNNSNRPSRDRGVSRH